MARTPPPTRLTPAQILEVNRVVTLALGLQGGDPRAAADWLARDIDRDLVVARHNYDIRKRLKPDLVFVKPNSIKVKNAAIEALNQRAKENKL